MFSGRANVLTAIEKARAAPVGATYQVTDETLRMLIQSPLSREVSCADASPSGGGSPVATEVA